MLINSANIYQYRSWPTVKIMVFDKIKGYNCKQDKLACCCCVPYYLLWKADTRVITNALKIVMQ